MQKHFELSQFEQNRLDGKIKLKPNAIPTIFDVPNPPPMIDPPPRKSTYKTVQTEQMGTIESNFDEVENESPNMNYSASSSSVIFVYLNIFTTLIHIRLFIKLYLFKAK